VIGQRYGLRMSPGRPAGPRWLGSERATIEDVATAGRVEAAARVMALYRSAGLHDVAE